MRTPYTFCLLGFSIFVLSGCAHRETFSTRVKTNSEVASDCLKLTLSGRPDGLFDHLLPSEISGMALTREKVHKTFELVVRPALADWHPDGPLLVNADPVNLNADAGQSLRGPNDTPGLLAVTAFMTDEGPKISYVTLLESAWMLKAGVKKGRQLEGLEKRQAVIDGFRTDRPRLLSCGIDHMVRAVPDAKPMTFDEFEDHAVKKLAEQQAMHRQMSRSSGGS